jgi:hypothetical protein
MPDLRSAILGAPTNLKAEEVEIADWGVTVAVRELTGQERALFADTCFNQRGELVPTKAMPFVLLRSIIDPASGERVFEDADADELMQRSGGVLQDLFTRALSVAGLSDEAIEAEGNV